MKEISSKEFESVIASGTVLIDVNAVWCGPCKMMKPILEKVEKEVPDVKFYGLDFDDNEDLAESLDVAAIPSLILYKNGKEVNRHVGMLSEEDLKNFIA